MNPPASEHIKNEIAFVAHLLQGQVVGLLISVSSWTP